MVRYSPSGLFNKPSVYELIEQLGLCVMQPSRVTGNHISGAADMPRRGSQQMGPHTTDPDGGVHVAQRKGLVCDFRTWRKNGKDEGVGTPRRGRSKNLEAPI